MTGERVKEVLEYYARVLEDRGIAEDRDRKTLGHVLWCCRQAAKFVDEGRVEKAMRWLGFVQGSLWSHGIYRIEDLCLHSKWGVGGEDPYVDLGIGVTDDSDLYLRLPGLTADERAHKAAAVNSRISQLLEAERCVGAPSSGCAWWENN